MKVVDILLPTEVQAATAKGIKFLDSQLKSLTVSDLKILFPLIVFKIHDPEGDGHAAAHVLNELHLRTVTMDFYPEAADLDEAIQLRNKEKRKHAAG